MWRKDSPNGDTFFYEGEKGKEQIVCRGRPDGEEIPPSKVAKVMDVRAVEGAAWEDRDEAMRLG
tara:strand:+ start:511 stop:702 length:192 start_codon:yes stop_codon:yes gene_type:complete